MTRLTLPWPPSLNRIWRAVGGKILLSLVARKYKKAAAAALPVGRVPPPLTGRLLVWMTLHPPLKLAGSRWDIANREKLMIDCLTEQRVWLDDSQIDAMVILRGTPSGAGRVELTIHTLDPGAPPL
jgi:crossover junction endodeoxyribonuclease RusA